MSMVEITYDELLARPSCVGLWRLFYTKHVGCYKNHDVMTRFPTTIAHVQLRSTIQVAGIPDPAILASNHVLGMGNAPTFLRYEIVSYQTLPVS